MAQYYPPEPHQTPQHQYPQHVPQHIPPHMQQPPYPQHVPPTHVPPQTKGRRRRTKPPASKTKLHRPLTRFYCNDCKKKFRSRILANRNNNAVQHYCQLYQKIITRKVDSHSNKCKGDHGMGPCVVKRTDEDPDSDGEDETKAAYYADKGKTPKPRKPRGAYSTSKKRKRKDDGAPAAKRARTVVDPHGVPPPMQPIPNQNGGYNTQLPVPPVGGGYYHRDGYAHHNGNGYAHQYNFNDDQSQPTPPIPQPPAMDYVDGIGNSSTPPIPMAMATGAGDCIPPQVDDGMAVPPPPPLEEFDSVPPEQPPLPPMEPSGSPMVPLPEPIENGNASNNANHGETQQQQQDEEGKEQEVELQQETKEGTPGSMRKEMECKLDVIGPSTTMMETENVTAKGEEVSVNGVVGVESVENENAKKSETEKKGDEENKESAKGGDDALDDEECINDGNTEDEDDLDLNLEAPISPTPNALLTAIEQKVDEEDDLNLEAPI